MTLKSLTNSLITIRYFTTASIRIPKVEDGLTNVISSVGSDSFLILIDSSIFLIWSGVYLKAIRGKEKPHYNPLSCEIQNEVRNLRKPRNQSPWER